MTLAEGGGRRALMNKFRDVYLPTLKANFILWPAVQVLNFRVVPIQFQIVSTLVWSSPRKSSNSYIAIRLYCRNWMDSISVSHQLFGRGVNFYPCFRICGSSTWLWLGISSFIAWHFVSSRPGAYYTLLRDKQAFCNHLSRDTLTTTQKKCRHALRLIGRTC